MRLAHIGPLLCIALLGLTACAEQATCVDGRVRGVDTIVVQCSTGRTPVCGSDPAALYNESSGALLPTPEPPDLRDEGMRRAFNGSCTGIAGPCRPRPACQGAAGDAPTCASGETPFCILGRIIEVEPPRDSGPPPPEDGGTDAGESDAGDADAGTDAGGADAGTDAG